MKTPHAPQAHRTGPGCYETIAADGLLYEVDKCDNGTGWTIASSGRITDQFDTKRAALVALSRKTKALKPGRGIHNSLPNRRDRQVASDILHHVGGFGGEDTQMILEKLCDYRHEILDQVTKGK